MNIIVRGGKLDLISNEEDLLSAFDGPLNADHLVFLHTHLFLFLAFAHCL